MEKREGALNMIGHQTNNEGFFAVPAPKEVIVDGCLEEWDLSGRIESYADTALKDLFSVKTAAMWDEDYLYLGFEWKDPYPLKSQYNPKQDKSRGWMADSIQLRILAGDQPIWITCWPFEGDKYVVDVEYLDKATYGWLKLRKEKENRLYYTGVSGETELGDGVAAAYREAEDGKGFTHELRLPWKVLFEEEHKATAGEVFRLGLDIHYGTGDGSNRPIHEYCDNVRPGSGGRIFFWTNPDRWGDLVLSPEPIAEPRIYRTEPEGAEGTISLQCKVPADAKTFTVTINTKDGQRVRNVAGGRSVEEYKIAEENGMAVVEVLWDGLDETGKLVEPGEYVLAGLTANGLDGYYETSFYNPGTPVWTTADKRGAWGADHTPVKLLAAAGSGIAAASGFAEGGFGTFVLETKGERKFQKRFSEIRGTDAIAGNDRYLFTIPNDWSASGVELLRMDVTDGHFVPYVRDGKEQKMPYPLKDVFGTEEVPKVTALALAGERLFARCNDNTIREIDVEEGNMVRTFSLGAADAVSEAEIGFPRFKPESIAADETFVYYTEGKCINRLNTETGEISGSQYTAAGLPSSLCMTKDGFLYIADLAVQQVLKCAPNGEVVLEIGKKGGRMRQGVYERDGMYEPRSVAVDDSGYTWVAENGQCPRRISVWAPDGTFYKEFIGNAGYCGTGTFMHTQDPDRAFAEMNELKRNAQTGEWEVVNVMYHPDPEKGIGFPPGQSFFDTGSMFYSNASGEEHEYYAVLGKPFTSAFFIMMKRGETWIPAAGIASVSDIEHLGYRAANGKWAQKVPYGELSGLDPADMVFWNDYNGDGYLTRDECVIVPSLGNSLEKEDVWWEYTPYKVICDTVIAQDDLSFYLHRQDERFQVTVCKIKPQRFRDGGIPVYLPEDIIPQTKEYVMDASAYAVPDTDLAIAFIRQDRNTYVAGLSRSSGDIRWKHLSPYHHVGGSHHAPMAKPGLLIGCLKITGCAKGCGDSDVFMIRGNLGEDYYMTTDGEFVDILTKDCRIPRLAYPETVEEMKKVSFSQFAGRGEPFSGLFARQNDGIIRCSGGMPACEAGNIIRIEGLEHIKHFEPCTVTVTAQELIRAEEYNAEMALAKRKGTEPIKAIRRMEGADEKAGKFVKIEKSGQSASGNVCVMYDDAYLHLAYDIYGFSWMNRGNDMRLLFKSGACVDFQCSPTGNREKLPVAGDFRLLLAPFEGKNVAVLMRQVDTQASGAERYKYTSPVGEVTFDTVRLLEEITVAVKEEGNKTAIRASVPWTALGMKVPENGACLSGDVGFIVANTDGTANVARIYRNNPSTNLVNDQPNEARINPEGFGEIVFE